MNKSQHLKTLVPVVLGHALLTAFHIFWSSSLNDPIYWLASCSAVFAALHVWTDGRVLFPLRHVYAAIGLEWVAVLAIGLIVVALPGTSMDLMIPVAGLLYTVGVFGYTFWAVHGSEARAERERKEMAELDRKIGLNY